MSLLGDGVDVPIGLQSLRGLPFLIGSADCMKRNLESRVEVMVPVEDPRLQQELRAILDLQLGEATGGWEMRADGTYVKRRPKSEGPDVQSLLIERAEKRLRESSRLRRRKPKGIARRIGH